MSHVCIAATEGGYSLKWQKTSRCDVLCHRFRVLGPRRPAGPYEPARMVPPAPYHATTSAELPWAAWVHGTRLNGIRLGLHMVMCVKLTLCTHHHTQVSSATLTWAAVSPACLRSASEPAACMPAMERSWPLAATARALLLMLGCCAKWTDPMRESVTDLAAGWQALLSLPAARAAGAAAATAASTPALRAHNAECSAARALSSHRAANRVSVSCARRSSAGCTRCSSSSSTSRHRLLRAAEPRLQVLR